MLCILSRDEWLVGEPLDKPCRKICMNKFVQIGFANVDPCFWINKALRDSGQFVLLAYVQLGSFGRVALAIKKR